MRRGARVALICAAMLLPAACGDSGSGTPDTPPTEGNVPTGDFPTVFVLSRRRFDPFSGLFLVREQFVVAFEDGTYSIDPAALFGEADDPPGTGDWRGEWRIREGVLETRFQDPGDDGAFSPQFFDDFRTTPGPPGTRIDGCFEGNRVSLTNTLVADRLCLRADGAWSRRFDNLEDFREATLTDGSYEIDGFRLYLDVSGEAQVRTLFAVLSGEVTAPQSILIGTARFSRD